MKCLNIECANESAYPLSLSLNITLGNTESGEVQRPSEILFGPHTKPIGTSCEKCKKTTFGEHFLKTTLALVGVSQEKNKPLAVDFDTKKFSYTYF